MRQKANKLNEIAATLADDWKGQASDAFHKVAELIQSDIQTASDAFERAYSALDTLANQLEQANSLYQQAEQIGSELQSLEWSSMGMDEHVRARISAEIAQLSYRKSAFEYEAQSIEYQANAAAFTVFDDIASMVNRLHFYHPMQAGGTNAGSVMEKIGHFFSGLWHSTKDEFDKIGNSIQEQITKLDEEAAKDPIFGAQWGFTEGFTSAIWDAVKGSWEITKILMGADPEKEIDMAKGILHAVLHPEQTASTLLDDSKVIFSTVGQSFDDDVIHGNVYTASKWVGYATGVVAQMLVPDGEGEVAAVRLGKEAVEVGKKGVQKATRVVIKGENSSREVYVVENGTLQYDDVLDGSKESMGQLHLGNLTLAEVEVLGRKYPISNLIDQIVNELGTNIKGHPLRQAYENEVAGLKDKVPELRNQGMSNEQIARVLSQERRDLGIKYKDTTPPILRDYIYAINMDRYGDKLGPSVDFLKNKYDIKRDEDFQKIIDSSTRPNPNVDELLGRFKKWLMKKMEN